MSDRTLRRAAAEGLIRVRRSGPRRTHVTVSEGAYLSSAWTVLSGLRAALRTEPNVRLAVLFGSVARGDNRPDSDLDLMVDLAAGDRVRVLQRRPGADLDARATRAVARCRDGVVRDVARRRWRRSVIDHLDDLPRQIAAPQTSLEPFGDDFDFSAFRRALECEDPRRYNQAQTVERAFARVQGYVARLADDGTKLAELPRRSPKTGEVAAKPWFEALRDADVFGSELCTRLVRSQHDRNLLEDDHVQADADDLHAAVLRLRIAAPEFARRYARWVEPKIRG